MPIIKSAKKAARQAVKRTAQNQQIKKFIKAALKAFKAEPTPENLSKAQSEYDKAAKAEVKEAPKTVKKAVAKKPAAKKTAAKKATTKKATTKKA